MKRTKQCYFTSTSKEAGLPIPIFVCQLSSSIVMPLKWLSDKVTYWAVLVTDEWSFKKRLKWKEKEAAAAPLSI